MQGTNNWFYGYWDRSADTDASYDHASDFQLLRHFGSDPINQLSGRTEFQLGKLWNLEDGRYYTSLWAEGGHPNGTMPLGAYARAEQWAVRRWVSNIDFLIGPNPSVGVIEFTGIIRTAPASRR